MELGKVVTKLLIILLKTFFIPGGTTILILIQYIENINIGMLFPQIYTQIWSYIYFVSLSNQ